MIQRDTGSLNDGSFGYIGLAVQDSEQLRNLDPCAQTGAAGTMLQNNLCGPETLNPKP